MIELKDVSFIYEDFENSGNGIKDINLKINEGECIVLCGVSGCGKTTLTRLLNGLIPHFYKGELTGQVLVEGCDVAAQPIAVTAKKVGSVFQNPRTQFFNVDTTSELAFGCENQGMPPEDIVGRIHEAKEAFSLDPLMDRSIFELSGGEKQRIACGSVYAVHPDVFVMDEPSSSLDGPAVHRLGHVIKTLKAMGKTIILSEHRLHYLKDFADRFVYMEEGYIKDIYEREAFLALKEEERWAMGLRTLSLETMTGLPYKEADLCHGITMENLSFKRGNREILNIPSLTLHKDEVVALIGHNGAGKSTFAHCLCGLHKFKGSIKQEGQQLKNKALTARSFMVMQDVNAQLFGESVEDEVTLNLRDAAKAEEVEVLLKRLNLLEHRERHPMALSGGQKQRVAIASAALAAKDILIYDEPTSGLDFGNMARMSQLIGDMEAHTYCTLIITHDPELILSTCHRVIHLEEGLIKDWYPLDEAGIEKVKNYFIEEMSHCDVEEGAAV